MQTVQLHELPFQFLVKLLHWIGFSDVLIWKGRLFQTGPYTFKVFPPKVTWFHSGVSRFSLYCSLINLLFSLTLKILFINSGFSLFILLIFQHTNFSTYLHSFLLFLLFLINLHKILSNHCIKIEALFFWRLSILFRDLAVENIQARRQ